MITTYISIAILVTLFFSVKDVTFHNRVIKNHIHNKQKLQQNFAMYQENNHAVYNMNNYNRQVAYHDESIDKYSSRINMVMLIGVALCAILVYLGCSI